MNQQNSKRTGGTREDERNRADALSPPTGAGGGDIRHTNFPHAEPESNVGPAGAPQTSRGSAGKPETGGGGSGQDNSGAGGGSAGGGAGAGTVSGTPEANGSKDEPIWGS